MTRSFFAALVGAIATVLGAPSFAQNAYITNTFDNTVSVISTATNTVVGLPIPVGNFPFGVAVSPDGSRVYVGNQGGYQGLPNTVSAIDTLTNAVVATIPLGAIPNELAVTPAGSTG